MVDADPDPADHERVDADDPASDPTVGPDRSASGGNVRRVRLLVAYDGAAFHGFAPNPGVRTVLGTVRDALETVCRQPVEPVGAGRTDAGVHGWGQVISADVPAHLELADLRRRVDRLCGEEIAIRDAAWAQEGFHARFSATSRTYRYHVWNDTSSNPLLRAVVWHVPRPIHLWALRAASDPLIGDHDFSTFCRRPPTNADGTEPSLVRRLLRADWTRLDDSPMLRLEISASSFCHQMVRSIVGTMVDVGIGRRTPADVTTALRARDRAAASSVAPPQGLVLWSVGYDGVRWDADVDDSPMGR